MDIIAVDVNPIQRIYIYPLDITEGCDAMPEIQVNSKNGIDLIWGAHAIASLIGRSTRATFHMLDNGELPAKKVGGRWVADRSKLLQFFTEDAV